MVQVMGFRKLRSDLETVPFKLEIEEPLQEEHAPPNKRFKSSSASQDEVSHHFFIIIFFLFLK